MRAAVQTNESRRIAYTSDGLLEHSIHDAEDDHVHADTEGERRDGDKRERGVPQERTGGIAEITDQVVHSNAYAAWNERVSMDGIRSGACAPDSRSPNGATRMDVASGRKEHT
jgi:hypothetical protein